MSEHLVTFSGKFGDILWSMPTMCALSTLVGSTLDFCCMPQYKSLLPLLEAQSYIDKAFVCDDWRVEHSNYGDQPWNPPTHVEEGYKSVRHLGYRHHPNIPLIDYIAREQGIEFTTPPIPFITLPDAPLPPANGAPVVAYAYNEEYADLKRVFHQSLVSRLGNRVTFVDAAYTPEGTVRPWVEAAYVIKHAACFVGCASANHVVACGVGQKRIFLYEPHPAKNMYGSLGHIFKCPYVDVLSHASQFSCVAFLQQEVDYTVAVIEKWLKL